MQSNSIRKVRVYSKYRRASKRWISEGREVPWVTLSGLWLQQAGFTIGDHLQVKVAENQLIITNQGRHGDQRD